MKNTAKKKDVRLFHSKAEEAEALVSLMTDAGYNVYYPGEREPSPYAKVKELDPAAVVIDLSRSPTYGRYVGTEIRRHKGLRHIPIVFVDGDHERVQRTRALLPDAVYTKRSLLKEVLALLEPVSDPVVPSGTVLSDRTTAEKLGIKTHARVALIRPPIDYARVIGVLPTGASLEEDPTEVLPLSLWFVSDSDEFLESLRAIRKLAAKSRVWIIYPKQTAKKKKDAGLTQNLIRGAAISVGLVDYKICSLDETWTGLALAVKKTS
jgi:CheY-like chemotaxis protein